MIADKAYRTVVALQVLEHLPRDKRTKGLRELARVSDRVLISLPWEWTKGERTHLHIGWADVHDWAGTKPLESILTRSPGPHGKERMVLLFDSEDILQRRDPATPCILPWIAHRIWMNGETTCCFLPPATAYERGAGGPYKGESGWNSPAMREQRKKMIQEGMASMCPNNVCCMGKDAGPDIGRQVETFKALYGGTAAYWEDLVQRVGRGDTYASPPLAVFAAVGDKCNASCPMCGQNAARKGAGKFPAAKALAHLRRACRSAGFVNLTGGDLFAFTDEEIEKTLALVPKSATVEIATNGLGLTPERYLKYIRNGPVDRVRISLDTVNPVMYRKQRGVDPGNLFHALREIARTYGLKEVVSVSVALNKWTLPGVEDVVLYARELGIPEVAITDTFGDHLPKKITIPKEVPLKGEIADMVEKLDAFIAQCDKPHISGWNTLYALFDLPRG